VYVVRGDGSNAGTERRRRHLVQTHRRPADDPPTADGRPADATLHAPWTPPGEPDLLCQYGAVSQTPAAPASSHPDSRVSARIAAIAESATLAVDAKAKALKAAGRPVIGFGAGEPDFPTPQYIVDAAVAACSVPANHRYTPAAGLPDLREAIAAKTLRHSGYEVQPSQVLVTNGGKQAVYQAFATIVDPGDEVLLPAPYWTTYPEAIRLAGGVPVEVFAGEDQGYLVTVAQLEAARTDRTKALLFCSPSNPTGAVYSPEQTAEIGRWALEHGIWVITDEIYEHLVYDDAVFTPMVRVVPELADTTIVLNGVAKTYAMTGWRVGWMISPADVTKAATNLQSHLSSNVANVSQRAAIAALTGDLSAVDEMRTAFDRRRRTMVEMLSAIDGVVCPTPKGAFYAYPSVRGVLGRTIRGVTPTTSAELAALILDQVEVAVVPGEAFGPSGYLRLSYALGDDDLVEGVQRIQTLLGEAR
jgi:aspartate/methionine/tyrosine aminotransferase